MIDLRNTLTFAAICTAIGGLLYWIFDVPFIFGFLLVGLALVLNGLLAEWEDRQPGGFYNPHDKDTE